jgi:hypothetical protein
MGTLLNMLRLCSRSGKKLSEYPRPPHLNFVTGTLFGRPTAENERAPAH